MVEAAPLPEIEGRSLRSFLDWLVAQKGWSLRFAGAAAEARAGEAVLHGSVAGLRADEALSVVLRTSAMAHRVRDGVLLVGDARP